MSWSGSRNFVGVCVVDFGVVELPDESISRKRKIGVLMRRREVGVRRKYILGRGKEKNLGD